MNANRRSVIRGAGAIAAGTLAGCLSDPPGGGVDEEQGYAAFFSLWDWTEAITGDAMSFENPVDVGEMGHGWEPPSGLPAEVAESGVFVYLDTPEFSWAQDLAAELERDHPDVVLIDAMAGLEPYLLPVDTDGDDRQPDDLSAFDPPTVEIGDLDVYEGRTGERVMYWHDGHWHGGVPAVEVDDSVTVEPVFEDEAGLVLPLGDEDGFTVDAVVADGAQEGIVEIETDGERITVEGLETGLTRIYFRLHHDGEVLWDSSHDLAGAEVVDEREPTDAPDFYDPHVWVDPVLAQEMVETIADELAEFDPDNADTYRDNAAEYVDRLDEVNREFETLAANATRDVVIFAGHDSFGYIDARYDFDIETSVGIGADGGETSEDLTRLVTLVEDHDIDTVLYDPFETPDPDESIPDTVAVILENTGADTYEPLTPIEGTTPAWDDAGYGWIEQMEEINLPSLRRALGAE